MKVGWLSKGLMRFNILNGKFRINRMVRKLLEGAQDIESYVGHTNIYRC